MICKNQTFIQLILEKKSMPRESFKIQIFTLFFYSHDQGFPELEFSCTYHCLQQTRDEQKMHKVAWRIYQVLRTTTQLLTLTASFIPKGHFSLDHSVFPQSQRRAINWEEWKDSAVHDSPWNKVICLKPKLCFSQWTALYLTVLLLLPLRLSKQRLQN